MSKFIVIILGALIIAGAAMSGFLSKQQTGDKEAFPPPACIDFDPPDTTQSQTVNGITYNLIKKNAKVPGDKVEAEMKGIGVTPDGETIYQVRNYPQKIKDQIINTDLIYVRQKVVINDKLRRNGFNIYLRSGAPLPDIVRNCASVGGTVAVAGNNTTAFPPVAFNSNQILNLTRTLDQVAWVYDKATPDTLATIQSFADPAIEAIGTIATPQGEKPLYYHLGILYLVDGDNAYNYLETDELLDLGKDSEKSLQLKTFKFVTAQTYSWWTPACKPAIYLYPQTKTDVRVRVFPQGYLTLTIPDYPTDGWSVTALPDGTILSGKKEYPYLYYESKIHDEVISKRQNGYVVRFENLPQLYSNILPLLGLNEKQTADFKEYWEKALPYANYYFVGVMDQKDIDIIEPLSITPVPDTNIRVRLYFEPLDNPISVVPPVIQTPVKSGFTMVEWGGMVKNDKNHPFTCSQ